MDSCARDCNNGFFLVWFGLVLFFVFFAAYVYGGVNMLLMKWQLCGGVSVSETALPL